MPNVAKDLAEILAQALRSGSPGALHVRGTSMLPTLQEGTWVNAFPARAEEIAVGRIAVFRKDDMIVVHRLIWKWERDGTVVYLFKGDNSAAPEKVRGEQILGEVGGLRGGESSLRSGPAEHPRRRWDFAGLFYHISFLFLSPILRLARILTGRPLRLPQGRFRNLLKRGHTLIESAIFRRKIPG